MADDSPRQTYCPPEYPNRISAITDLIRWGPSSFSPPEFLMLLYYAERTLTYGKRADASSLSQITGGIFSFKTMDWIRGPAGLSRTAVKKANTALSAKGFLVRRHAVFGETRYRPDRGNEATEYEINWTALSAEFNRRKRASRIYTPIISVSGHRILGRWLPALPHNHSLRKRNRSTRRRR